MGEKTIFNGASAYSVIGFISSRARTTYVSIISYGLIERRRDDKWISRRSFWACMYSGDNFLFQSLLINKIFIIIVIFICIHKMYNLIDGKQTSPIVLLSQK